MKPYIRRAFYYETDQMGIVHHSNYIRWMEEARLDHMAQGGVTYDEMERAGVIMPVVSVDCQYKNSVGFNEAVAITVVPVLFNGVRASFRYEIRNERGVLMATGASSHCFLDKATRRPLNLKRRMPEYAEQCEKMLCPTEVI